MSASMSGVSVGPTKFLMARPKSMAPLPLSEETTIGVEGAQHRQLTGRWRIGRPDFRGLEQLEAGILPDRLHGHAGVGRLDAHALRRGIEAEDAERRDHARDTAEEQPRARARAVAREPRRARDEVDARHEAALLVRGDDDH